MDLQPLSGSSSSLFWSWRLRAACRSADSSLFFAADGERDSDRRVRELRAKAVCAGCPVRLPCRSYALAHQERYGIWGGLSERERAQVWAAEACTAADPSRSA
jgi:WhiB family transcriptional regulator, redox-sensing transcriptional regulator